MEKFFEKVSLGILLRWSIAGAMCLISFNVTRYGWSHLKQWEMVSQHYAFYCLLVVIIGAVLYGVHRSILYPRLFKMVGESVKPRRNLRYFAHMIVLWDTNRPDDETGLRTNRHTRVTDWGDIAHSQITGALGVVTGMIIGPYPGAYKFECPDCLLTAIAIVLFLAGTLSIMRLISFQRFIEKVCLDKAAVDFTSVYASAIEHFPPHLKKSSSDQSQSPSTNAEGDVGQS